jgi:t-SNARE complex subunit (syntaxin)
MIWVASSGINFMPYILHISHFVHKLHENTQRVLRSHKQALFSQELKRNLHIAVYLEAYMGI